MTMSLAFLAPDLVKAVIEERLPRGIGVTRLRDAPARVVAPACDAWLCPINAPQAEPFFDVPARNGIFSPRERRGEMAVQDELRGLRERSTPHSPANWGQLARLQEHSANGRLCGGPGSCTTIQQFQQLRLSNGAKRDHGR